MAVKLSGVSIKNFINAVQRYEFRSMRGRLLTWMMITALIPAFFLVLIGLMYAEQQLEKRALADLSSSSKRLHHDISLIVNSPLETVRVFSRSPYLREALNDFSSVFDRGELYSMDYQDMQDKYWAYFSLYAEKNRLRDLLILNKQGEVVFSAVQSEAYGADITHIDFIGTGMQAAYNKALWQMDSAIAFSSTDVDERTYAFLAAPVVDDTLLGVIILIPEPEELERLLSIHSHSGQVVNLYSEKTAVGYKSLFNDDAVDRTSSLGKRLSSAMLGTDFDGELDYWKGDWLVSIRSVPVLQSVLVQRRDKDVVLQSVRELRYGGWGITLVVLIMTFVLSRRLSHNLAAPVFSLTESIERISEGDREVSVDVNRKDELGKLAQQFNQMAVSLRDTQAQLVQTEKMASIGHLAAGVAHEINNPMSVVTANMTTMKEYAATYVKLAELFSRYLKTQGEESEQRQEILDELEAFEKDEDIGFVHQDMKALLQDSQLGLSRVQHIVSSLKLFSELDKSEEEEINLRETLEQVVSDVAPAQSRQVEITYDIELDGKVKVKPEQMRRVFSAIIDNAVRACVDKGSLRIKAWRQDSVLLIDFQDTGCGMAPDQVNQVLDPFFTTREVGEGIGLGLSVAHSIVEAHAGTLNVASKEGRGTRVRIALPGH
jgi:signal transduction histidine kinase